MASSKPDLDGFADWLGERGLSSGTIGVYVTDVKVATTGRSVQAGLVARLRDPKLAPKTKRHTLAAGRRWAEYAGDKALAEAIGNVRLPPPRRQAARVPITRVELFSLIDEINRAKYLTDVMRATIGMMACRGFRVGDVLRLRRTELEQASEHGELAYEAKGRRRLEFKVLRTYKRYVEALLEQPGDWGRVDELISPHATAKCRRDSAAKAVRRALTRVGVKLGVFNLHPHRLRRTYAVEYLRSMKGDPEAIIKLTAHMRWASMATAMEYVDHDRGEELDKIAERIFERDD